MDFDDLDDAIEQRMAEGGELPEELMPHAERIAQATSLPRGLPPCARNEQFPLPPELVQAVAGRDIRLRTFLFYGPGQSAASLMGFVSQSPSWLELMIYEWPGHGSRSSGDCGVDDLVEDAYVGMLPSLEVKADSEFAGAPFALIGHSVGAQVATQLARKIEWKLGLVPCSLVAVDRAAPDVPLFSSYGEELLKSKPEELLKSYRQEVWQWSQEDKTDGPKMLKTLIDDLQCHGASSTEAGFHKLDCDVLVLRSKENAKIDELAKKGSKYQMLTLEIDGSDETLTIPVQIGVTNVSQVKATVSSIFGGKASDLKAVGEKGELQDTTSVGTKLKIQGLKGFKNPHHQWPHPIAIIGTGYCGIKTAAHYAKAGNYNFMVFDRHDRIGGDAWLDAATKYSKIQTDFAAFNIWWGSDFISNGKGGFGRSGYETWYKRPELLESFKHCAEEYGVMPYIRFETDVAGIEIVGGKDDHDRHYKLKVDSLNKSKESFTCLSSVIYHFPGSYSQNRIIDYPGEDTFGGQIGYGMGKSFNWEDGNMKNATVAILGNGAFAIENVRTSCEFGADKVYLVTRRKNLASPRIPCWFVHQGPVPTPAGLMLRLFQPMYKLTGMGDPFDYWAVTSNSDQSFTTISQASRFGIGDVTFLCHAYGKLEYVEDTLKRLTHQTLHLNSGRKLENVTGLIKSLGLVGDFRVDKLHGMTERAGNMINSDYRRVINIDATGMHASNFTTFSLGIGVCNFIRLWHFIHDNPFEYLDTLEQFDFLKLLPKHKASKTQPDQPVYMTNVQYEMGANMMFGSFFPQILEQADEDAAYKYALVHTLHPIDKILSEAKADWDKYQKLFKEQGSDHEYIEYPYNKEMLQPYFDEYSRKIIPISINGPSEEDKKAIIEKEAKNRRVLQQKMTKRLVAKSTLHADSKGDPYAFAIAKSVHGELSRITSSKSGSAAEFDLEQFQQWSAWTSGTCSVEEVEAGPAILQSKQLWEKIIQALEKSKVSIK